MILKITLLSALVGMIAIWIAIHRGVLQIPERFNPWATLALEAPPNFLTRYKLNRLSTNRQLCREVLSTSRFRYEVLDDRITGFGCGFHNAVRIEAMGVEVGEAFALSCRAAVSLALWERHVLQPAMQKYFGQPAARIEHYGSYSCRNVYGRPRATRSRHATAEAFDIAGFVLADGKRIRVLKHWEGESPEAEALRELRTGACRFFDAVLSPNYNEAHGDHFHFDRGPYRVCR